jgi:PBP1b-binding outer membrane lipoprotein LpoB
MKLILSSLFIAAALLGCASSGNKKLDQKMAQESKVSSTSDLRLEAQKSIESAINLTSEQKEKLNQLRKSVSNQTDEFNKKSLELRSILLTDLLAPNYNANEVRVIKSRMRKLEDQRLSMIFDAADKANVILDRQAAANHLLMRQLIEERDYHE